MYTGPIIDTHMHLWDLANGYAWLSAPDPNFERLIGNYEALRRNFIASDYASLTRGHHVLKSTSKRLAFLKIPSMRPNGFRRKQIATVILTASLRSPI